MNVIRRTRWDVIDLAVLAALAIGFVSVFGLGVWAATGKLHILPRGDRLPVGLALGVVILIVRSHLREQQQAEDDRRIRAAMDEAYALGHADAKEKRNRRVTFSDVRWPYVTEEFIYRGGYERDR